MITYIDVCILMYLYIKLSCVFLQLYQAFVMTVSNKILSSSSLQEKGPFV